MSRIRIARSTASIGVVECLDCPDVYFDGAEAEEVKEARRHVLATGHRVSLERHVDEVLRRTP